MYGGTWHRKMTSYGSHVCLSLPVDLALGLKRYHDDNAKWHFAYVGGKFGMQNGLRSNLHWQTLRILCERHIVMLHFSGCWNKIICSWASKYSFRGRSCWILLHEPCCTSSRSPDQRILYEGVRGRLLNLSTWDKMDPGSDLLTRLSSSPPSSPERLSPPAMDFAKLL